MPDEESNVAFSLRHAVLEEALARQSLHREILYKTLSLCCERKGLVDLEQAMGAMPEFAQATQSQYHLITVLVDAGGLDRVLLDASGVSLSAEQLAGLSEDEQDDLVFDEAFETTPIGMELVHLHAPLERLRELIQVEPERATTYCELLAFCANEIRSYGEIQNLLDGREVLVRTAYGHREVMQPSVLVDKLQRAAGLVWKKGWSTTKEGKAFLEEGN